MLFVTFICFYCFICIALCLHKATNLKMCVLLTEMYSKVLHSLRIQYDTARIQRYHNHKEHTEVKKQSILSYPLVIWCLGWHLLFHFYYFFLISFIVSSSTSKLYKWAFSRFLLLISLHEWRHLSELPIKPICDNVARCVVVSHRWRGFTQRYLH